MKISVNLTARDLFEFELDGDQTRDVKLIGCHRFLSQIKEFTAKYGKDISKWPISNENDHVSILIRELILKVQNNWKFPYEDMEICHCRKINTDVVDQAIIAGAHTIEDVRKETGANTACGTCQPDIEKILEYRLKK